jgi:cytoskeletal protein RodZ
MDAGHSADRSNDFGGRMKRLREERGIKLRDIAETTKISVSALEALERNDISRLPGGIFSRGFVRAYAEQIGADPERTVREFLDRFPSDPHAGGTLFTGEVNTDPPSQVGRHIVITALILVPVAAVILWSLLMRA